MNKLKQLLQFISKRIAERKQLDLTSELIPETKEGN